MYGKSVQQTIDGGYIITGFISGHYDTLLAKFNSLGEVSWVKGIGNEEFRYFGFSVSQTSDEGYVIAGSVKSSTTSQPFLAKFYVNGTLFFLKHYQLETGHSGSGSFVMQVSDGSLVTVGSYLGFSFIMKTTSSEGEVVWGKIFGKHNDSNSASVVEISLEGGVKGYAVCGSSSSNQGGNGFTLSIFNTSGHIQWSKIYEGEEGEEYYCKSIVKKEGDYSFLIGGIVDDGSSSRLFVAKLDSQGTLVWVEKFSFNDVNSASIVVSEISDRYLFCGGNNNSIFVGQFRNDDGGLEWVKQIKPEGEYYGNLENIQNANFVAEEQINFEPSVVVTGYSELYGGFLISKLHSNKSVEDECSLWETTENITLVYTEIETAEVDVHSDSFRNEFVDNYFDVFDYSSDSSLIFNALTAFDIEFRDFQQGFCDHGRDEGDDDDGGRDLLAVIIISSFGGCLLYVLTTCFPCVVFAGVMGGSSTTLVWTLLYCLGLRRRSKPLPDQTRRRYLGRQRSEIELRIPDPTFSSFSSSESEEEDHDIGGSTVEEEDDARFEPPPVYGDRDSEEDVWENEEEHPDEFCCGLTYVLMTDPVTWEGTSVVVERSSILRCLSEKKEDPFTRNKLTKEMLKTLPELRERILEYNRKAHQLKNEETKAEEEE